jgi:two-component system cell cycle response regulator
MDLSPQPGRSVRILGTIAALALIAHLAHTVFGLGGRGPARFFDLYVYLAVVVLAAGICLARAFAVSKGRGAWLAMGAGLASSAVGDLSFEILTANGATAPYPSIADAFYLGFYLGAYVALVLLLRQLIRKAEPGLSLDGIVVGLALAAVAAAVVFPAVVDATSGSTAVVATALAYPVGDLVLLIVVAASFTMTGLRPGRPLALIAAGLLLWAVADSVYALLAAQGTYSESTWLDSLWPAGALLVGFAAWQPAPGVRQRRAETLPVFVTSAGFMLLALGLVLTDRYIRLTPLALWLATAAVLAGVARASIAFTGKLRALRRAETEALTDGLTGLGNRRLLVQDLEQALDAGAAAPARTFAFYDLDGFKQYNDVFGHSAGDALLMRLGNRLAAVVDGHGSAYRLGGDEFCLLLDCEAAEGDPLLAQAEAALSDAGNGFDIGSSSGSVTMPREAVTPELALKVADERMYAQKGTGRRSAEHQTRDVLLQILRERGRDQHDHLTEVARHSVAVARRMGLPPVVIDEVRRAAQLHDIGTIAIPAEILRKPGPLDDDEWAFVRQHTIIGERVLAAAPALRRVATLVRMTHERWDGCGYPDGLAGEEVAVGARIVALCDAYDAMVSPRTYRTAMSHADALDEVRRCSGSQFDPAVVEAFLAAVEAEGDRASHAPPVPVDTR